MTSRGSDDPGRSRQSRLGKGWLADALRALPAAWWWNARKSAYRWRGRKGACPCQDQSDSGEAGRTRCVAVQGWKSPERFQTVCPLLTSTSEGWRCSVSAQQVRPFWGRCLGLTALVAAVAYLLIAGVALVGLKQVGYPDLHYSDLAWPGHWPRVRAKQAEYFRRLGWEAWVRQDYAQALVALSSARQIEPADYQTALFLATLWSSSGNEAYGDTLFEQLLVEFPGNADRTRVVYHDQLLAAQRLGPLAELALERRVAAAGSGTAWDHPLHFAALHGRLATRLIETRREEVSRLPEDSRQLIEALRVRELEGSGVAAKQIAEIQPYSAGILTRMIEALVAMHRTDEAAFVLAVHRELLSGFEAALLRYRITVAAGDPVLAESDFLAVVAHPLTTNQADQAIAGLVSTRDRSSLRRLWAHLMKTTPAPARSVLASAWVAALHAGDAALAQEAALKWERAGAGRLPAMTELDLKASDPRAPGSLKLILTTVELPRDTVFALVAASVKARGTAEAK